MDILGASIIAALAWIIAGGILYAYPPVKRVYKRAEKAASVKKWSSPKNYIIAESVYIFVQCFLFALVFSVVKISLSPDLFTQALQFGLIITAIKTIPRTIKMAVHTTYPGKLLFVEFLNSIIGAFGVSFIYAFMI